MPSQIDWLPPAWRTLFGTRACCLIGPMGVAVIRGGPRTGAAPTPRRHRPGRNPRPGQAQHAAHAVGRDQPGGTWRKTTDIRPQHRPPECPVQTEQLDPTASGRGDPDGITGYGHAAGIAIHGHLFCQIGFTQDRPGPTAMQAKQRPCLLYQSDAAEEKRGVEHGGSRWS